jgi:hypothetical protein
LARGFDEFFAFYNVIADVRGEFFRRARRCVYAPCRHALAGSKPGLLNYLVSAESGVGDGETCVWYGVVVPQLRLKPDRMNSGDRHFTDPAEIQTSATCSTS